MKEKIIIFIIGLLVGAVLATGAFLIYTKVSSNNNIATTTQNGQMPSGNPPEMNGQEPPKMPNGEKPDGNLPEKQNGENDDQTGNTSGNTSKKSHSKSATSDTNESN